MLIPITASFRSCRIAVPHPNICHIYDVGPDYLVMELVEWRIAEGSVAA